MKYTQKKNNTIGMVLLGASAFAFATSSSSAAFVAGIDFDVPSGGGANPANFIHTAANHLSVPATQSDDYLVTHNGVTFDIEGKNANLGNANRFRGGNGPHPPFPSTQSAMTTDFIQWFGRNAGAPVEATISLSGLDANRQYDLSLFVINYGAFQTEYAYFQGSSAATGTPLGLFTPNGADEDFNVSLTSDASGELVVTIRGGALNNNNESRLQLNGITLDAEPIVTIPEPSSTAMLGLASLALLARRNRCR